MKVPHISTKTGEWPPDFWAPALVEMGRLVFNWNTVERTLVQMLNILTGSAPRSMVLTTHMGTPAVCDALRTVAQEFLKDTEREHILHCVSLFERLRDYRNYYVHAFHTISYGPDAKPTIGFLGRSARSRLVEHRLHGDASLLAQAAMLCHEASHYMAVVHNHFAYPENKDYQQLPEKHPLPNAFQKPKKFLLEGN